MTDALLCAGNGTMGNDGAGSPLAEKCAAAPKGNWVAIDSSSAPESDIVAIRELRPMRLLIVDATDTGLSPDEICIVDPADIVKMFMMTTRSMPLSYLIDQLKEDIDEVIFLGIQPDIVGFYYPITQPIKDAVETVYQRLEGWGGDGGFAQLTAEEEQFFSKKFRELSTRTGMCASLLSLALPTQTTSFTEYLPMSDNECTQKQALEPLLTVPYGADQNWHLRKVDVTDVTLEETPDEDDHWRLTAKDHAGKFRFIPVDVLQNMASNAQFYHAGLDRNGIQNLVIWRDVSGNGLAPSPFLILMTFDQQGHPCVFQVDGFYTASETGADDLLDLQGNGHTQLLDMQFDSGYWVTSLYQVKEVKWRHVHGWFDKLNYPAFTRFTYTSNRKPVIKPIAGHNPQTKDLALTQRCLVKGDVLDGVSQG